MSELTASELATLNWMRIVNDRDGWGLFGPSVRAGRHIPEAEALVRRGWARLNHHAARGKERCGYWILPPGRTFLSGALPTLPSTSPNAD